MNHIPCDRKGRIDPILDDGFGMQLGNESDIH
eukprot:COSAG06_NODE_51303_length_313_cov_0.705607_1_plen_31_part_10